MKTIYFILLLFFFSCSSNTNSGYQDPREKQKLVIYDEVIRFVSLKLKSPSTAIFPEKKDRIFHVIHLNGNKYSVVSWVDSQNSYGAMLRSNFMIVAVINVNNVVKCSELVFLDN